MDVKLIIRDLLARGMSIEEVKKNLDELGIENADELIAKAREHSMKEVPIPSEKSEPKKIETEPTKEPVDAQELEITSVSNEGEKQITLSNQKQKPGEARELFTAMPKTEVTSNDDLEGKLDEIIALLKALQEVNKKVLETDREVLLRLKT